MTLDAIERAVVAFCADWSEVKTEVIALSSACDGSVSELNTLKESIRDLTESRRAAPRSERGYYRDQIREARDAKDEVVARLRESRAALARAQARQAQLGRSERDLRHSLSAELRRAASGAGKLAASPAFIGGQGISGLSQKVREHHQSLQELVRHVDQAVRGRSDSELVLLPEPPEAGRGRSDSEVVFLPEPPDPCFWATPEAVDEPLRLIEPPRFETYLTQDGKCAVPTAIFSICDTHDVHSLSQEQRGVFLAESYLRLQGHTVVLPIGGAGLLDMLSLDSSGKLWVTEVKETETGRSIAASGLDRQYSSEKGLSEMHENAPNWLLRETPGFSHVASVFDALAQAIETSDDPGQKEGLRQMRDSYSEAVRQGFTADSASKSLIQVGFADQSTELRPPEGSRSQKLDEWIENVAPANIVQIEVAIGSANSEMAEQGQAAHQNDQSEQGREVHDNDQSGTPESEKDQSEASAEVDNEADQE